MRQRAQRLESWGFTRHGLTRSQRVHRVARYRAVKHAKSDKARRRRPLKRHSRKSRSHELIAYDFETTSIKGEETPRPLYITAFGKSFQFSQALGSYESLEQVLINAFLTPERSGTRFVAWNGNKFDSYFIALALMARDEFIIQPYLTAGKSLRGMRVTERGTKNSWEFLDGISMLLGGNPRSLKDFLKVFAPDYHKLDAPDWEKETFNPSNPVHVAYAERDSEGLYHGLMRASAIVEEHFGQSLQPTIGNLGIRLFQQEMPEEVRVWAPSYAMEQILRGHVLRGGYCHLNQRYSGPVWKYDLNQAYAAAMRETPLPAGSLSDISAFIDTPDWSEIEINTTCALYRVRAVNPSNTIPFYCADERGEKVFLTGRIDDSWITSMELAQLRVENWDIEILEAHAWSDSFSMCAMVDRLEQLRVHAPGGPKSAQGEMMKALGNNAYGKTCEQLDGLCLLMSRVRPVGYSDYQGPEVDVPNIWCKLETPQMRDYHQPQIGAFITAHVRMVLRRAILQDPGAWIYSDTDCVVFSRPVTLDIDPGRYGAWKIECANKPYRFIAKKVYYAEDWSEVKAKGVSVKKLTRKMMEAWYDGRPPREEQVQRNNILNVMAGKTMFRNQQKVGQKT